MKKKINKYDIILIACIIIINVLLIFYSGGNAVKDNSKIAYIYSNNKLVKEYVLTDNFKDEITIKTDNGYNTLHIENGEIWIHDASCPDKLCIYQGKISGDSEIIVCLPNKLLVKIQGNDEKKIDFIAQ